MKSVYRCLLRDNAWPTGNVIPPIKHQGNSLSNYSARSGSFSFPRAETVQEFRFFSEMPDKPVAVGWAERSEAQQSMGYAAPFVGLRASAQPTADSCTVSARGNEKLPDRAE